MKSLEALIFLEETYLKTKNQEVNKIISQYTGYIKKDLEALNIFRKAFEEHLFYLYDYSSACKECYILMIDADEGSSIELTKQEYDLLKEVLGDE